MSTSCFGRSWLSIQMAPFRHRSTFGEELPLVKFILGISYVNRRDLLYKAVNSVESLWPQTIVIDNSEGRDLRDDPFLEARVKVYEPPVPLTVPQKFNYLQELAEVSDCDVYLHMHNDGKAPPGAAKAFLARVQKLLREDRRWGIAFTNYDVLSAVNMEAVRELEAWDNSFIQYFSDNDYYWRLHAAGYEHVWTGIRVIHHGSASTQSDPYRKAVFKAIFPLHHKYYEKKWGGKWFKEKNRQAFTPDTSGMPLRYPPKWKFP
ncbi:MAG: glycosyltransferase family 2 protein [Cohnella sp.]|nr:glycosyltransferase family 2 protein [Cohnella sp.]